MNKRQAKKLQKQRAMRRAQESKRYASDIYGTSAEITSAVNRINGRIKTAVSHFGTESKIVQDMFSLIDALVPLENQRFTNDGVLQIARPASLYTDQDMHEVINAMDTGGIRTYKDIKEEYTQGYDSYKQSADYDEEDIPDIDAYIIFGSELVDALQWAYDNSNEPEAIEINKIMSQSRKSYSDLLHVIELYREGVSHVG